MSATTTAEREIILSALRKKTNWTAAQWLKVWRKRGEEQNPSYFAMIYSRVLSVVVGPLCFIQNQFKCRTQNFRAFHPSFMNILFSRLNILCSNIYFN